MNVLEAFDDGVAAIQSDYQTKANPDPTKAHRDARAALEALLHDAGSAVDDLLLSDNAMSRSKGRRLLNSLARCKGETA